MTTKPARNKPGTRAVRTPPATVSAVTDDEADALVKEMLALQQAAEQETAPPEESPKAAATQVTAESPEHNDTRSDKAPAADDPTPQQLSAMPAPPVAPAAATEPPTAQAPALPPQPPQQPEPANDSLHPANGNRPTPQEAHQPTGGALELHQSTFPAAPPPLQQPHTPFGNTFPGAPSGRPGAPHPRAPQGFGPFGHVPEVPQYQQDQVTRGTIGFSTTKATSEFWKNWLKANTGIYGLPDGVIPPIIVNWIVQNRHEILRAAVMQFHGYDIGPEQTPDGSQAH